MKEKTSKFRGAVTRKVRCPHCKKQFEGTWERKTIARQCALCFKEFTLDEMPKLFKKPKPRTKQPSVPGRTSGVPEKGMPSLRVSVHDIRISKHPADTSDSGGSEERGRNLREVILKEDSRDVKSIKHFCVDPQENLRRVLEARRHG